MKWHFDIKRFFKIFAGYAVLIVSLDFLLTRYYDINEPKQSIIEIFGALIIFQILEELYRRYKK